MSRNNSNFRGCPYCFSTDINKNGKTKSGDQRYHCKQCGKNYVYPVNPPPSSAQRASNITHTQHNRTTNYQQSHQQRQVTNSTARPTATKKEVNTVFILQTIFMMFGFIIAFSLFMQGGLNIIAGFFVCLSAIAVSPIINITPFMKNRPIIRLIIQFVCGFWLFVIGVIITPSDAEPSDRTIDSSEPAVITITADQLASEFHNDESSAKQKSKNSIYEITGTYDSIRYNKIVFKTDIKYNNYSKIEIECKLKDGEELPEKISKGDLLTIRGELDYFVSYSVKIKNAYSVSYEKPTEETTENSTKASTDKPTTIPANRNTEIATEPITEEETEIQETEQPETTPTPTPAPAPTIEYWINTDSGKIHYSDCRTIKDKTEPHWKTSTASKSELIAQGYDPCGVCMK